MKPCQSPPFSYSGLPELTQKTKDVLKTICKLSNQEAGVMYMKAYNWSSWKVEWEEGGMHLINQDLVPK